MYGKHKARIKSDT